MKRYIYNLVLLLVITSFYQAMGQTNTTVTGTVSDKVGALPGVSVSKRPHQQWGYYR
jgi:hypothetical protein